MNQALFTSREVYQPADVRLDDLLYTIISCDIKERIGGRFKSLVLVLQKMFNIIIIIPSVSN